MGGLTGQKKLNATRIGSMDGDVKLDFFFFFLARRDGSSF